jgi:hypothetical protein
MKHVDLGFQDTDSATREAANARKDTAIATGDKLPATPENPKITFIKLIKRNNKASPNIAGLLFRESKVQAKTRNIPSQFPWLG